jgi:hypothetical protein
MYWSISGPGNKPQYTQGWFTADNQTIVFGGTSPGDGDYRFAINDNNDSDNNGTITLTWTIA